MEKVSPANGIYNYFVITFLLNHKGGKTDFLIFNNLRYDEKNNEEFEEMFILDLKELSNRLYDYSYNKEFENYPLINNSSGLLDILLNLKERTQLFQEISFIAIDKKTVPLLGSIALLFPEVTTTIIINTEELPEEVKNKINHAINSLLTTEHNFFKDFIMKNYVFFNNPNFFVNQDQLNNFISFNVKRILKIRLLTIYYLRKFQGFDDDSVFN